MLELLKPHNWLVLIIASAIFPSASFSGSCIEVIGKKNPDGTDSVSLICQRLAKITFDLNDRIAMDKLYKSNPEIYLKARNVTDILSRATKEEVESEIVRVGAENVVMGRDILFMTNPPQTNVSFFLGETKFEGRIYIDKEIFALKRINMRGQNQ